MLRHEPTRGSMMDRGAVIAVTMSLGLLVATGCGSPGGGHDASDTEPADVQADDLALEPDTSDVPADTGDAPADTEPDVTVPCTIDGDCDDGQWCNGAEVCGSDGLCDPGTPPACDDSDPCTMDGCDEVDDECTSDPLDGDGDGYVAAIAPDGTTACGGADCDDTDPDAYPGADASELACDLLDRNCDGDTSEHIDDDGDGWIDEACDGVITDPGDDYEGLDDCDDTAADVYPGASEGCDGTIDNDCDGDATEIDADGDDDGHAPSSCDGGDDCDDTDASIHPGATELCDTVDQDCDGEVLDAAGADDDSDGHLDESCGGGDCDDTAAGVHPGATELCDAIDQDCDGEVLEAAGADDDTDGYLDVHCGGDDCDDLDRYSYPGAAESSCDTIDNDCDGDAVDGVADDDGDDYLDDGCTGGDDCDDTAAGIHPGATDLCDTIDQDCDGSLLDGAGADDDGDTVLDTLCGGDDCDDTAAGVHPGAAESSCDTIDNDCDGDAVDGMADDDDDDYMDNVCAAGTDCDDTDASAYPGAPEICANWVDNDCDTIADGPVIAGSDVRITNATEQSSGSGIAWGGSQYGVTWADSRHGTTNPEAYFARVSGDGAKLGSDVRITNKSGTSGIPEAAWSGSEFGMVWHDIGNGGALDIFFARVSATGTKLTSDVQICNASGVSQSPSIAWSGSEYAVCWQDGRTSGSQDIYLARISGAGAKVGSDVLVETGTSNAYTCSLVWTGSEYGVAWQDDRDGNNEIYFRRISPTGGLTGTQTRVTNDSASSSTPLMAWAGSRYGIAWSDTRDVNYEVYMSILSSTGSEVVGDTRITPDDAVTTWCRDLIWMGTRYGIFYSDNRDGDWENYFSFVTAGGTKEAGEVQLNVNTANDLACDAVWTGSELGYSWTSDRDADQEIYFNRLTFCD